MLHMHNSQGQAIPTNHIDSDFITRIYYDRQRNIHGAFLPASYKTRFRNDLCSSCSSSGPLSEFAAEAVAQISQHLHGQIGDLGPSAVSEVSRIWATDESFIEWSGNSGGNTIKMKIQSQTER
jgi:hypothetical protein